VSAADVRSRPGAAVRPNRRPAIQRIMAYHKETAMNEEEPNISIRKFLKMWASTRSARSSTPLRGPCRKPRSWAQKPFAARMTLEIAGLRLKAEFDGEIRLEAPGAAP
jgi:hypothetical protein